MKIPMDNGFGRLFSERHLIEVFEDAFVALPEVSSVNLGVIGAVVQFVDDLITIVVALASVALTVTCGNPPVYSFRDIVPKQI